MIESELALYLAIVQSEQPVNSNDGTLVTNRETDGTRLNSVSRSLASPSLILGEQPSVVALLGSAIVVGGLAMSGR